MSVEKRQFTRYGVRWNARILLEDRSIYAVTIKDISLGGVGIDYTHGIPVGTQVNIEFYVLLNNKNERIRAKTEVAFQTFLADNKGVRIGLRFTYLSDLDKNTLSNIIHALGGEQE